MASIEKGHLCTDAGDFIELLRWWWEKTDEATIGDIGSYRGTPWVRVPINGIPCHLNADSRRQGVKSFLDAVDSKGARFSVVANQGGNVNLVAVGSGGEAIKYFYLYTDEDLPGPAVL